MTDSDKGLLYTVLFYVALSLVIYLIVLLIGA